MSTASPTAFLLWAILSVLFQVFLTYHLWSYDRFQCLRWSSGRQPGAFKRVMTYSYLCSVPLFVIYSVAMTALKYNEGFIVTQDQRILPRPVDMYTGVSRRWYLPLNFVFSFGWALELVTHLEELAFWLYLLHQTPEKGEWFESWEYKLWYCGSIVAIIGMPLTCMIARRHLETVDAYIFLSGSAGSLSTTVAFLYVLWRFPRFIRHVKFEGADPTVVVRLCTFYQLNLARVVFRFMFTVPLLMIAIDGISGTTHPLNSNLFSTDFLLMIGGVGCFVSSAITLLIFFPRSILREAGYKPRASSTVPNSPKDAPISPQLSNFPRPIGSPSGWDAESAFASLPDESLLDVDGIQTYHLQDGVQTYHVQYVQVDPEAEEDEEGQQAPPYPHRHPHRSSAGSAVVHQRHPFPHSLSSPQILTPPASPAHVRVTIPPPVRHARQEEGGARQERQEQLKFPRVAGRPVSLTHSASMPPSRGYRTTSTGSGSGSTPRLHPYVMTFTSPIDLVDLSTPEEFPHAAG